MDKAFSYALIRHEARRRCLFFVSALLVLCAMQDGSAEAPTQVIGQFVVLVHPCPYEALRKPETDPYRALERVVCERWFEAIPSLPQSTFAIQVDFGSEGPSPDRLHRAFVDRLGVGRVCRIPCEATSPEDPDALIAYYDRIHQRIHRQMTAGGLSFDPITCRMSIWGQSFEGCAAGFGSAIANGLGLKTLTQFDYAMSVPDAAFMLDAAFVRSVPIPDSDVQAYVFDLADGRCAAFFRSCLTPQWLDHRPIELALDAARFTAVTKQGDRVWPDGASPAAKQRSNTRYNQWRSIAWPEGTQPPGPLSLTLATVQERYVITGKPHLAELVSAIEKAVVNAASP